MPEIPASHRDLLDGEFATLATIGPDGHPQLSEVWFLAEGEMVVTSLNTSRQKIKNLRANPAATVFLLDLAVPYRYLELRRDAPPPQPSNPSPVSLSGTPASWPPCNPGPVRSLRGTRCPGRPPWPRDRPTSVNALAASASAVPIIRSSQPPRCNIVTVITATM